MRTVARHARLMSHFAGVQKAPPDPILNLALLYKDDKFPQKVNLGIGAYRTPDGKPWPLPSVREAEKAVAADDSIDKEYLPIDGLPALKRPCQELVFSGAFLDSGKVASTQALSGTGSLSLIGRFLHLHCGVTEISVSDPTWGNHPAIFGHAGLKVSTHPYYHNQTRGVDREGMNKALNGLAPKTAVLLHSCAHNPTGADPTDAHWAEIIEICKQKQLIPVLDNAYQGYASGDLEADGKSVRMFQESGLQFFVAQSFAKNFGLYGERIGNVHAACASQEEADRVLSQLKIIIRQNYSSPPIWGARVVTKILTTPALKTQWLGELRSMSERIVKMRDLLRTGLEKKGTPGTWNHITDQIGMFSYTGLSKDQCNRMQDEFHIYLTKNGRISMAGLNEGNMQYVTDAIDACVRGGASKL